MTLPSNYTSTTNKLAKIWEQVEANRITVDIQSTEQTAVVTELKKSIIRTFDNNQFLDLSTSYVIPIIGESQNNKATIIYYNWEFDIKGLLLAELIGYKLNFLFKFGTAESLITDNIRPISNDTNGRELHFSKYFSTTSLVDSRDNTYKLHVGFYLQDFNGITEFNQQQMNIAVNLLLINPRYFN